MKFLLSSYILHCKIPLKTSYGILYKKKTYFLKWKFNNKQFISECPYFQRFSSESENLIYKKLYWICNNFLLPKEEIINNVKHISSVLFCYEQILRLLKTKNPYLYFPSGFTNKNKGITVNGLIWMGKIEFIKKQIQDKIKLGYRCLKLKIGNSWEEEFKILQYIRKFFPLENLEIRVDANGAFKLDKINKILDELYRLQVHSIEQPIKVKNWKQMFKLCQETPIPIALDEELIGISTYSLKEELLNSIRPQYLVLKPSLIGGIYGTSEWIKLCKKYSVSWWITSALESNIGLNFIAQWVYKFKSPLVQGLGTGELFTNNLHTPLFLKKSQLFFSINNIIKH